VRGGTAAAAAAVITRQSLEAGIDSRRGVPLPHLQHDCGYLKTLVQLQIFRIKFVFTDTCSCFVFLIYL
jgi:hypothetical protein